MASVAEEVATESTPALSVGALADLYGRLAPSIRRLCQGYMRDLEDADDLTQETFLRLAARLDTLDGDPAAYAFRIARNLCCDELARRRRRANLTQQAADAPRDDGDAVVARSESRDLLERIRQSLTSAEFAMFVDIASGHSQAEVADRLRITETNVSVRLCRARKKVRVLFGGASAVAAWTLWRRVRSVFTTAPARTPVAAAPAVLLTAAMIGAITLGTLTLQPWNSRNAQARTSSGSVSMHPDTDAGARVALPTQPTALSTSGTPAAPSSAPVTASGLAQSLVNPGKDATPQETGFTSIAVSPDYDNDHTVLAAGTLAVDCGNPLLCNVLFRSSDGGHTWTHLAGQGFAGGTLLLPPAFATSRVVYAMGALGLQVSNDGGASFTVAVPGQVAAAIAPSSTAANTDVLLGTSPLTVYHSATKLISAGPQLPLGTPPPDALAFSASTGTLFATADTEEATGAQDGEVIRCDGESPCAVAATAPHAPGLQLAAATVSHAGNAVAAFGLNVLLTSWDDGRSFTTTSAVTGSIWRAAAVTRAGTLFAVSQTTDGAETPRAFSRPGAAAPLTSAVAEGVANGAQFATSVSLPDGNLLAGLQPGPSVHLFGLTCSTNGRVWSTSC